MRRVFLGPTCVDRGEQEQGEDVLVGVLVMMHGTLDASMRCILFVGPKNVEFGCRCVCGATPTK